MEKFRQILREAVSKLRKQRVSDQNQILDALDSAYNKALDDVTELVINQIPD